MSVERRHVLAITRPGIKNLHIKTEYTIADLESYASKICGIDAVGVAIESGSFKVYSMAIAPCSVKTLSTVATILVAVSLSGQRMFNVKEEGLAPCERGTVL